MPRWVHLLDEIGPVCGRGHRSDFDLVKGASVKKTVHTRPAAVLVPLVRRNTGTTVLLTRRAAHLSHHPGQISFPGGKVDQNDRGAEAAALRELEEETGIGATHVSLVGRLDAYHTVTGFTVTPVLGLLEPGFVTKIDFNEVAEIFEVPLEFLMDRDNHQCVRSVANGQDRAYYAMAYGDYYIWGATAAMLVNLADVLNPCVGSASR